MIIVWILLLGLIWVLIENNLIDSYLERKQKLEDDKLNVRKW